MLRHNFITQEDHEKAVNTLDIEISNGVEPFISEDINDIIKSIVNYVIAHDKEELMELSEDLKKEVTEEENINLVLKLEKLIELFLTQEFLEGESILSLINQQLRQLRNQAASIASACQ